MIAMLTGSVVEVEPGSLILDVQGVGYRIFAPLGALSAVGEPGQKATFHTALSVSANTMEFTLFGFLKRQDLQVFQLLIGVNGVGPKAALAMLSTLDTVELCRAISSGDAKSLTKVPGIGPKLAQRICLELGEKLTEFLLTQKIEAADKTLQTSGGGAEFEDVVEALLNLGYSRPDSRRAAERVISGAADASNTGALIREALNLLSSSGRR